MLSLFSGIGGLDLAAEWAGIETVMFCEKDPFCQRVLKKHWPSVPIISDVADVIGFPVDIVTGGYPCQPFSTSGKRKGVQDVRHLWPEMLRIVRECQPTWVVGENVKGHVTLGLDEVLCDLENEGYEARAFLLPACSVGAPHIRERVFIVANLRSRDTREGVESFADNVHRDAQRKQAYLSSADGGPGICAGDEGHGKILRPNQTGWWETEPAVGRVVYGIPAQPHRFKQLGNTVVPQQAYPIFKAIKEISSRVL